MLKIIQQYSTCAFEKKNMTNFSLTDKAISRLQEKFKEFHQTRSALMIFLVSYISDYQKFHGSQSNHNRFLHQKYSWQTPKINYLFNSGNGFYWSIRNIAIVLGRNRSSITRTMHKMKVSEEWNNRLSSLRRNVKSDTGLDIEVYHQDIFDLLLDYYEEEYLLRFAEPRHGNIESAPDIDELRRFWKHLRAMECIQKSTFVQNPFVIGGSEVTLPISKRYRIRNTVLALFRFLKDKSIGLLRFILPK